MDTNTKKTRAFCIEDVAAGRRFVTRDGREARVICTDADTHYYPLVVLIKEEQQSEWAHHYNVQGQSITAMTSENPDDMLTIEEPERGYAAPYYFGEYSYDSHVHMTNVYPTLAALQAHMEKIVRDERGDEATAPEDYTHFLAPQTIEYYK